MNILMITGIFPPDIGGPASYVPAVSAALAERGHTVTVITLSDETPGRDAEYPFTVIRIKRRIPRLLRVLKTIAGIIRLGKRSDLLYVHGLAMEAVIANLLLRKPFVQKVVGDFAWERMYACDGMLDSVEEFQRKKYGVRIECLKKLQAFWVQRSDAIITPSNYLKTIIKNWDVAEQKITVIHNAVKPLHGRPGDSDEPALLRQGDTAKKTIVTVGRLFPYKNFAGLIRVIAALPETRLFIIGDGPLRLQLETLIREKLLQDRVHLTGGMPKSAVFSFLKHADVFILNSVHETFPHVVLEAMQADTPVIATSTGGTPEIIRNGCNGILIPPGNPAAMETAIREVLHNQDLRKNMVAQGRETLKKFDWQMLVEQTESVLRESAHPAPCNSREPVHAAQGAAMIPVLFLGSTRYQIPPDPSLRKKWRGLAPHFRATIIAFHEGSRPRHYVLEGAHCLLLPARLPRVLRYALHFTVAFFFTLYAAVSKKYPVIIAQSPYEALAPALALLPWKLLRSHKKPRLIVEVHSDWGEGAMLYHHASPLAWLEKPLRKLTGSLSLSQADAYRVISEYCRSLVPDDNKPVFVFPTFTDLDSFSDPSAEAVREAAKTVGGPYVIFVGMLIYLKGIHNLIRAFKEVTLRHPGVKLVIAGQGKEEQKLKSLTLELALSEQVMFTGFLEQTALAAYIKASQALILPSLTEGLGRVAIEAQFLGKPVVASRVGGIPEIIADGETGLLIEPGDIRSLADAMHRLLDDTSLAVRMGNEGKTRVAEKFDYQNYYNAYFNMVREVCAR